ncbi:hypothetical protein EWM64_g599 [Hericium alpestre]|uniref:BTB domain-containing protein n=1 Tax=Hericium alpestre TaxID=135208 RepID=A0A4Z0A8K4_9AGAM|nr:hypothetical protein EWM64_g599 [Hericium alpestre]
MVSDLFVFDLETLNWEKIPTSLDEEFPGPRYFHSADTWDQYLIIFGGMGGQDLSNVWLDDVYVYNLKSRAWIRCRDYPRHCGTYRSVAVAATLRVRHPQEELKHSSIPAPSRPMFRQPGSSCSSTSTSPSSLQHLPYSAQATDEFPNDIYLYSNYNFTDVKRELEVFTPLPGNDFSISDQSTSMTGNAFPPGLRFPTGAILGTHLIIAGTYLAHSFQSFSVWALDLINMTWSRVDPGSTLSSGSWFRSCLWADANKFLIFGNRNGNLVDDYNRRLLSWDHVAVIDLEAFGIYQPPRLELDIRMQEMGLAALEEGVLADFEIVCDDERKVKCSRKVLEDRWPWFRKQREFFLQAATKALETVPASSSHLPLPDTPGKPIDGPRPDPRLTPRLLRLSEPWPVTMALVQYFYSLALITPLQHAPAVLSALLVLATNYELPHLQSLVKHAMHRALSNSTSVGVYEVATLCSCRSLQIRALKTVMLYNQKRPSRSKQDKDRGGRGGHSDNAVGGRSGSGSSGGGGGGPNDQPATARPRGMSDAWMRPTDGRQMSGARGYAAADDQNSPQPSVPSSSRSSTPLFLERKVQENQKLLSPLSVHADLDGHGRAVAEELSPAVVDTRSRFEEQQDKAPAEQNNDEDSDVQPPPLSKSQAAQLLKRLTVQVHSESVQAPELMQPPRSVQSPWSMQSPGTSPSRTTSSDSETDRDDELPGRLFMSPSPSSFPSINLTGPHKNDSIRYSDVPSLTSSVSRSSFSSSHPSRQSAILHTPPVSPSAMTHQVEPRITNHQLASINESNSDDVANSRRFSTSSVESKTQLSFAHPSEDSPRRYSVIDSPIDSEESAPSWLQNSPNLEALRAHTKLSSETITPGATPFSPVADHETIETTQRSHRTPSVKSSGSRSSSSLSLSRFFSSKGEKPESPKKLNDKHASVGSSSFASSEEGKQRKAEEKRRRKEEARMKTIRLAEDLKKRAEQRAIAKEMETVLLAEDKKRTPVPSGDGAMYGGVSGVTL